MVELGASYKKLARKGKIELATPLLDVVPPTLQSNKKDLSLAESVKSGLQNQL